MQIGIVTIATGKYSVYIPELIESCETLFLCDHDRKYFIYTDCDIESLGPFKGSDKIIKIHQEKLGWPYDSMLRFHMFEVFKNILLGVDYIFFMNANMKVVSTVDDSILPSENECGIVATIHPGYYKIYKNKKYPYDSNSKSEFYVPEEKRNRYFQGCFNGGRSSNFLEMCEILKSKMDIDLYNNIIPLWHDESALNWYLANKDPLILEPLYAYPEYLGNDTDSISEIKESDPHYCIIDDLKSGPKIIQRNKDREGGKKLLRA